MSGRSGYRKTDRKRSRFARPPRPKDEYVLRFQLPKLMAAFLSPGAHGYGTTIGFNDVVFVSGATPAHCAQLAADFLDKVGARRFPQNINATIVKLLPCPGHCPPVGSFRTIGSCIDLEAIHDNVSRNAGNARAIAINVTDSAIVFVGVTARHLVHDYSDERSSTRQRA
jgi:hypothetical protein